MRIEYERVNTGHKPYPFLVEDQYYYEYRLKTIDHCCQAMQSNFHELIVFGESGIPCVSIHWQEYDSSEHSDISYCPWCGKPIELIEVGRFKKVYEKVQVVKTVDETTVREVPEDSNP